MMTNGACSRGSSPVNSENQPSQTIHDVTRLATHNSEAHHRSKLSRGAQHARGNLHHEVKNSKRPHASSPYPYSIGARRECLGVWWELILHNGAVSLIASSGVWSTQRSYYRHLARARWVQSRRPASDWAARCLAFVRACCTDVTTTAAWI
jgi:hypothetical protein